MSLDGGGKMVRWIVEEELGGGQVLRPSAVIEMRHLVQRMALQGYGLRRRGERYIFVNVVFM